MEKKASESPPHVGRGFIQRGSNQALFFSEAAMALHHGRGNEMTGELTGSSTPPRVWRMERGGYNQPGRAGNYLEVRRDPSAEAKRREHFITAGDKTESEMKLEEKLCDWLTGKT